MPAHKTSSDSPLAYIRRRRVAILGAVLLIGLIYAVIPQIGFFSDSRAALLQSDVNYLGFAVFCLLLSFAAAAAIYMVLTPRPLRAGQTYLVQIAGAFAGKVLPAGLGSISVNYLYLRNRQCSQSVAATVVAVNNMLGFAGHGLWLLVLMLFFATQIDIFGGQNLPSVWLFTGLSVGFILFALVLLVMRKRLGRLFHGVGKQLRTYKSQPRKLAIALLASMLLTACNIAIVWLSAQALGVPLSLVAAAIALTGGVLAQTATPTPGGVGGVEAGLVAGLVLSGVQLQSAIAVTILFRLVTFWLPLALGPFALLLALRKKLL